MSAALDVKSSRGGAAAIQWLPVIAGLLVLYVPSFYGLAKDAWRYDDFAHGPIILGIILWLIWRKREALLDVPAQAFAAAPAPGLALLVCGLLLYVFGRSQEITLLEVGSLAPVLAGVFLAMRGWPALRALWFPILFVIFVVPLPQFLVDALSGPLKQNVSAIAEQLLYAAGYPIARAGVVLAIGQYQLLVADACSGLNSIFSLMAVGAFYLYLVRHQSWLHNVLILASLLPVAVCANILRVIVLVLVTYRFGDAAGQGFLHLFSGMMLFATALFIILLLDAILARAIKPRHPA
jgi:exosortase B